MTICRPAATALALIKETPSDPRSPGGEEQR
jgi:hypothetical protein